MASEDISESFLPMTRWFENHQVSNPRMLNMGKKELSWLARSGALKLARVTMQGTEMRVEAAQDVTSL